MSHTQTFNRWAHLQHVLVESFKQRSFQTVLVLTLFTFLAPYIPLTAHRSFYTFSLFLKDILMWVMPVTVGIFIAHTVQSFERKAILFILTLVAFETLSNFAGVWYAFGAGKAAVAYVADFKAAPLASDFSPLLRLPFARPSWLGADKGAFLGLTIGLLASFYPQMRFKTIIGHLTFRAEQLLTKVFAPLIPLFILGFAAQLYKTDLLTHVFVEYGELILWLLGFLLAYITFLFVLSAGFNWKQTFEHIKNLLPAGGLALSSGCSLSTMPWTIAGAAKNLKNPELARAIIPATTNIQQIGDGIANTFLCFLIYRHFKGVSPDFFVWLQFSIVFVLARFATAAVIGGAIFIMVPIYEGYLGFNGEMIAIILALNVLLDPIITSTNVMANGALCRVFERVWEKVRG